MVRKKKQADPVEVLNRYARAGGVPPEDRLADMLVEESDRGVVIILGSWVEDTLLDRICEKLAPMSEGERTRLVERGPLRDFNARILMARAMGILTERDRGVLETIKAMRNACAHSRRDISFQTPELRAVLLSMMSEKDRAIVEGAPDSPFVPRAAFITVCSFVLGILQGETVQEAHARIQLANRQLQEAVKERLRTSQETPTGKSARDHPLPPSNKGR